MALPLAGNYTASGELALPFMGELHPTYAPNSENGPIPHHGCGRADLDGMGIGELAPPIT